MEEGFKIKDIASMLSVSERTIYRRMQNYGLSSLDFTDISDEELDRHMEISRDFPHCGEGMLKFILKERGIRIARMRLRDSIHLVDMQGVQERRKGRLQRRVYNVKGPNHLWHVDTNHKLVRWNFIIIGGIDGYSRLPVMVKCKDNNKADTLLCCFMEAVDKYGIPSRIRTGQGLENVRIVDMISRRGTNRGSAITGKSTHNQRIERLWRDVYQGVLALYYQLFYFMEDEKILDPLNDLHLVALHHVYLHKIQEKLDIWNRAWSQHRMRTTRSSPIRMWVSGQLQNAVGIELRSDDVNTYAMEGFVHDDEEQDGSGRPIFNPPALQLDDQCKEQLDSEVPSTWTSSNHGIDVYLNALRIVQSHATDT